LYNAYIDMMIFQILFALFGLFVLSAIYQKKKQGVLGHKGFIFWVIFWVVAIVAVFWPNSTQVLAVYVGIGRGTDLVVYVSLAVMFFVLFRLHVKIESIGRDVTKVVRKEALSDHKK